MQLLLLLLQSLVVNVNLFFVILKVIAAAVEVEIVVVSCLSIDCFLVKF